jgi:NAD+ kinase
MIRAPRHVGIVGSRDIAGVRALVPAVARWIRARGARVSLDRRLSTGARRSGGDSVASLARRVDLLLVLGGDGAMLHASRAACRRGVPILGVNLGGLGFLTEIGTGALYPALTRVLRGDFHVERRLMVEARVLSAATGRTWSSVGLNDAVIHARDRSRVVAIDVRIGRTPIGSVVGDGLIVSTPTGSTAYSLSAGGPIVRPTIEALIATPISPHTLTFRPLLVGADESVVARIRPGRAPAAVTVDGQRSRRVEPGDEVLIRKARTRVDLVTLEPGSFYEVLRSKFAWAEPPRGLARRK